MALIKLGCIEACRGLAATTVVLYHTARHFDKNEEISALARIFQFGHAGVDLFFVISGFIILFVHYDDIGKPDRLGHYLGRRLTRLLPLYWVALILTIAIAGLGGHSTALNTIVWAILPVPASTEPIPGVAWTLRFEFVFYAAFAVLILHKAAGLALMALWLSAVVWIAAMDWHPAVPWTYWGIFNLEFFVGMAVAYRLHRGSLSHHKAVLWAGATLFATAAVAEDLGWLDGYASFARLVYGLSSMLILLGAVEASRRGHGDVPRALRTLGSASYSLYLFHFLFIGVLWHLWGMAGLDAVVTPAIGIGVFAAVAIGGGIIVSRLIEYPLIRLTRGLLAWHGGRQARPLGPDPLGQTHRGPEAARASGRTCDAAAVGPSTPRR